jgi:hypothetical protein
MNPQAGRLLTDEFPVGKICDKGLNNVDTLNY